MKIELEGPDRRTVYFGVSDFQRIENGYDIWFQRETGIDHRKRITGDVDILSAVDEAGYDKPGAYETIGDLGVGDAEVIVACTPKYPAVTVAAAELKREAENGEYSGEFELVAADS
jgi:hypothetical protein